MAAAFRPGQSLTHTKKTGQFQTIATHPPAKTTPPKVCVNTCMGFGVNGVCVYKWWKKSTRKCVHAPENIDPNLSKHTNDMFLGFFL